MSKTSDLLICFFICPIVLIVAGAVLLSAREPNLVNGQITSSTSHWYPCTSSITGKPTLCVDYLCTFNYLNSTGASIMEWPCSGIVQIDIDGNPPYITTVTSRNPHTAGVICLSIGLVILFAYFCCMIDMYSDRDITNYSRDISMRRSDIVFNKPPTDNIISISNDNKV